MNINNMIGYKIFKEEDDKLILYRIIKIKKSETSNQTISIKVKDLNSNEIKKLKLDDIKGFTPLEPDGYITFNCVNINTDNEIVKDVIVTASKFLNLKIGDTLPYAICRQSITDIFYNLLCKDEGDMIVGLSVNQDDCPSNFDFPILLSCDGIDFSESIHYYRTDTIEDDILPIISIYKYNEILFENFKKHIAASNDKSGAFRKQDKGWCKDLNTLLLENTFQSDVDQMLGITAVKFKIEDELIEQELSNGEKYFSFNDTTREWLSSIFKINIKKTTVIEYDYDVDTVEFKNTRYLLLRDNTKKLYLVVYTLDKEELEIDLIDKANESDFSTKYRLDFYNKYNQYNKKENIDS